MKLITTKLIYLFQRKNIFMFCLLLSISCSSIIQKNSNPIYNTKIKSIKDTSGKKKIFTHKYLKNNTKTLPLIINTGIINKNNSKFTELIFSLNSNYPINYTKITLSNSNEQIWTWDVYKNYRNLIQKRNSVNETYSTRVDIMTDVLSDFFKHEPIYLTFQGTEIVQKTLDRKHVISLLETLSFADNSPVKYLLKK